MKNTNEFIKKLTNLLFPRKIKCILCKEELKEETRFCMCSSCYKKLLFNDGKVCLKCGEKIESLANYCMNCKEHVERYFTFARAPLMYGGDLRKIVHELKYKNKTYLADYLGEFLIDEYIKSNFVADVIVPIPLNIKRQKERGFNQAEIICYPLAKRLELKIDNTHLVRTVDTPTQTKLTKKEREENLKNAFTVIDTTAFKGKNILLVDDIFTTGSTMEEASKPLLKAGAKSIFALSIAHTIPIFLRSKYIEEEYE